jgi:hypothetical protein
MKALSMRAIAWMVAGLGQELVNAAPAGGARL